MKDIIRKILRENKFGGERFKKAKKNHPAIQEIVDYLNEKGYNYELISPTEINLVNPNDDNYWLTFIVGVDRVNTPSLNMYHRIGVFNVTHNKEDYDDTHRYQRLERLLQGHRFS